MIEKNIYIRGKTVRYLEAGSGLPLILLHSWPYCADIFYKNIEVLAKKYHVVAPDFPGFGQSETADTYASLDDMANFVIELANHLHLGKFNIVGVSMGGTIALLVASKYPQNVTRTVVHSPIYDPNWFWNNPNLPSGRFLGWLLDFPIGKRLISSYMISRLHYWMRIMYLDKQIIRKDRAIIQKIYRVARLSSSKTLVDMFGELVSQDFRIPFHRISCPVLVIQGENDLVPKQAMEYLCTKVLKNAKLKLVKKGNHDLVFERFNDFNQLVSNFL